MSEFDPYKEWLGIEPHEHPVDHYRLLGLSAFESDTHVISVAADQRMNHVRSFQTGPRGKLTQPLLNEIALARRTLLNDKKRRDYDEGLRAEADVDSQLPPGATGPFEPSGTASAPPVELPSAVNAPAVDLPASVAGSNSPAMGMPSDILPQPTAPPPASHGRAGYGNPAPATSIVRTRRSSKATKSSKSSKSSGVKAFAILLVGIVAVAGIVWGVGTYWNGNKKSEPGAAANPEKKTKKKRGLERKRPGKQPAGEVVQESTGEVNLTPSVAGLHGPNIELARRGDFDILTNWTSKDDLAEWKFRVIRPGIFRMEITYEVPGDSGGSYELLLDGEPLKEAGTRSGAPSFIVDEHHLAVRKSGWHTLTMRPSQEPNQSLMIFKSIKLIPQTRELN